MQAANRNTREEWNTLFSPRPSEPAVKVFKNSELGSSCRAFDFLVEGDEGSISSPPQKVGAAESALLKQMMGTALREARKENNKLYDGGRHLPLPAGSIEWEKFAPSAVDVESGRVIHRFPNLGSKNAHYIRRTHLEQRLLRWYKAQHNAPSKLLEAPFTQWMKDHFGDLLKSEDPLPTITCDVSVRIRIYSLRQLGVGEKTALPLKNQAATEVEPLPSTPATPSTTHLSLPLAPPQPITQAAAVMHYSQGSTTATPSMLQRMLQQRMSCVEAMPPRKLSHSTLGVDVDEPTLQPPIGYKQQAVTPQDPTQLGDTHRMWVSNECDQGQGRWAPFLEGINVLLGHSPSRRRDLQPWLSLSSAPQFKHNHDDLLASLAAAVKQGLLDEVLIRSLPEGGMASRWWVPASDIPASLETKGASFNIDLTVSLPLPTPPVEDSWVAVSEVADAWRGSTEALNREKRTPITIFPGPQPQHLPTQGSSLGRNIVVPYYAAGEAKNRDSFPKVSVRLAPPPTYETHHPALLITADQKLPAHLNPTNPATQQNPTWWRAAASDEAAHPHSIQALEQHAYICIEVSCPPAHHPHLVPPLTGSYLVDPGSGACTPATIIAPTQQGSDHPARYFALAHDNEDDATALFIITTARPVALYQRQ